MEGVDWRLCGSCTRKSLVFGMAICILAAFWEVSQNEIGSIMWKLNFVTLFTVTHFMPLGQIGWLLDIKKSYLHLSRRFKSLRCFLGSFWKCVHLYNTYTWCLLFSSPEYSQVSEIILKLAFIPPVSLKLHENKDFSDLNTYDHTGGMGVAFIWSLIGWTTEWCVWVNDRMVTCNS